MLEKLLKSNIVVQLRLNCDLNNFDELSDLLDDLLTKYGSYENFIPYFAIIFATKYYSGEGTIIHKENLSKYSLKIAKIMDKHKNLGMNRFPLSRGVINCYGSNPNSIVIGVDGVITKCQSCPSSVKQAIGNIKTGIEKNESFNKWVYDNLFKDCCSCKLYPICLGGCVDALLSNKKLPCIKEKYYIDDLLLTVGNYMLEHEIYDYKYE